jgi:hypothetical protein
MEAATFAFDIRLCTIKLPIYTLLYSKNSLRQPEAEMEDVIWHVVTTLDAWKRSLPTNDQVASIGFPCDPHEIKVPLRLLLTWIELPLRIHPPPYTQPVVPRQCLADSVRNL